MECRGTHSQRQRHTHTYTRTLTLARTLSHTGACVLWKNQGGEERQQKRETVSEGMGKGKGREGERERTGKKKEKGRRGRRGIEDEKKNERSPTEGISYPDRQGKAGQDRAGQDETRQDNLATTKPTPSKT